MKTAITTNTGPPFGDIWRVTGGAVLRIGADEHMPDTLAEVAALFGCEAAT